MKTEEDPNCGIILTGDFNRLNTSRLQKHFKLKQLVKFPTRGNATLDLVLTNMGAHFATPEPYPPFGLSDHCTAFVRPKERIPNQQTRKSILSRDKRDSNKARLGRYFSNIDWSCVTNQPSCEEKLKVFSNLVDIGKKNIMPERSRVRRLPVTIRRHPEFLEVTPERVYENLSHLNKHKAPGPDGLSNWCLKEYAELLYQPIADILNSSYKEQKLPSVWKHADVTPLPKVKQVADPKKELRPISLTASLSKVAEDFLVSDYIRPVLERIADSNQFGTVSGSSTVLALLSMIHEWLQATDGNSASVCVFLFDYRKAFDFIDHGTLAAKLRVVGVPNSIVNWILEFLSDRTQRVKLSPDCMSEWGAVPAGVLQGTKLGPWLFLLMINDLLTPSASFGMWKYVDDTTLSKKVPNGQQSRAQEAVDHVSNWSVDNLFQLNLEKTKELAISFCRFPELFDPVIIDGTQIQATTSNELLGLTINNTLTWNDHVDGLVKKAARKIHFLVQLKRARVPAEDLVAYY
ncbi:putative RNA-directed DNA polymerase from transposon BS [Stylophora pistillata]|uniref:Putative RNA-directed DNA polymerase from transposon BS n=1 Tax=Stylophora pistillata TaxID=50429 RepID=A0A2B4R675_STYPI|nr:putative RNA-directed DNA polymerase from transposon BS [Stylophora pistillata]